MAERAARDRALHTEALREALHLREMEEQYVLLTESDAEWLTSTHGRHLTLARHSPGRETWLVRAGRVCGIIALPSGRRVYIEPRVPVRNIWTLLGLAGETDSLGWPPGAGETFSGLVEGVMQMFVREVALLIERGVAIGYRQTDEVLACVRGRLDVQRQVRELPASLDRFACRFAEFTRETPENRVLAAALQVVLRASGGDSELRARAAWCLRGIGCTGEVNLQRHDLAAARVSAATRQYRVPLSLARLLLQGLGAGHRSGGGLRGAQTPSMLVEMPRLFERFVCRTLERSLPPGTRVRYAGHSRPLDDASHAVLTPDAVVEGMTGAVCVVDAKYKPEPTDRHEPSASDIYQMLAYCVGYGVREAVLLYPRALDAPPLRIRRDGFSATIHPMGIDLSAEAHTLRPQGELACARIAELAGLTAPTEPQLGRLPLVMAGG